MRGSELKPIAIEAGGAALLMLMLGFGPALVISALPGIILIAGASKAPRPRDLIVRGAGFLLLAAAVLAFGGTSWLWRAGLFTAFWTAGVYWLAWYLKSHGNDALEKNALGAIAIGALVGALYFYPDRGATFTVVTELLVVGALISIAYAISSYVYSKLHDEIPLGSEGIAKSTPRKDSYAGELERAIKDFVERGDKAALLVEILDNRPLNYPKWVVVDVVRKIVEHEDDLGGALTPTWLRVKYARLARERRKRLVSEVLHSLRIKGGGGVERP